MKLQDFFPFDSAVLGLENLYSEIDENSFYVQSGCIISKSKILTKGKHYLIFDIPTKTEITITEIILIDLFYYESSIHLIAEDISTQRVSIVSFCLECPETNCTRFLVDIKYFIQRMNAKAVKDYCGDCASNNETKQKSARKQSDELLEFEF